jgi:hypothetical protein
LNGVGVAPTCQAWAVGGYITSSGGQKALIEYWNGTAWTVQPTPNIAGGPDLDGVAVASAADAWAVGAHLKGRGPGGGGVGTTLIEHWSGRHWSVQRSPNRSTRFYNQLYGVAAASPNRAWAVGYYYDFGYRTLIEEWDGRAWKVQSSPNPGGADQLGGVTALDTRSAWAVGFRKSQGDRHTLIEHWNGRTWQVDRSPNPSSTDDKLLAVAALGRRNVWAVGVFQKGTFPERALIEHWNGKSWQVQPSPNGAPGRASELTGVAAFSPKNVWAVGTYLGRLGNAETLIEHWDGHAWNVQPSFDAPGSNNELSAVAAVSSKEAVAVGDSNGHKTLSEYWDGSRWTG